MQHILTFILFVLPFTALAEDVKDDESSGGSYARTFRASFGLQLPHAAQDDPNPFTRGFVGADIVPSWWTKTGYLLRLTVGARLSRISRVTAGMELGVHYLTGFDMHEVEGDSGSYRRFKYKNPAFDEFAYRLPSLAMRFAGAYAFDTTKPAVRRFEYDIGMVVANDTVGWAVLSRRQDDNIWLVLEVSSYTFLERPDQK